MSETAQLQAVLREYFPRDAVQVIEDLRVSASQPSSHEPSTAESLTASLFVGSLR